MDGENKNREKGEKREQKKIKFKPPNLERLVVSFSRRCVFDVEFRGVEKTLFCQSHWADAGHPPAEICLRTCYRLSP